MEIHVDSPSRGYLPGALIRGEVELDVDTDGEQGILSIVFSGRSMIELKAWSVGPGDYGRNTQLLMTSRTKLYEGNSCYTDMPAGGYPFLFTFPSKTHNALGESIWSKSAKYGSPKNWPPHAALGFLPRSLSFTGGPILSATIEYRLDVKWVSGTRQKRRSIVLPFDTYRSEPSPQATSVTATDKFSLGSTSLIHRGTHPHHLNVAKGSIGKMEFKIETRVGTKVVQGGVPLVKLRLSYPKHKSTTASIPAVRLQFLTVHLERVTAVRTPRRAACHMNTVHFSTSSSLDLILPEETNIDISNTLGLRSEDMPYDLYTYNLRQTHNLRLYFTVECMGKRFEFQKETDLALLSPFYEESPPCFTEI